MATPLFQPIRSLLVNGVHRFASLWEIERTDGTFLRFTDHDTEITFENNVYTPVAGFNAGAQQRLETLKARSVETIGVIDSSAISDADLKAGKYREAKLTHYTIDWRYPWAGHFSKSIYWIAETVYDGEVWQAKAEGVTRWLTQKIGFTASRTCRHRLGRDVCALGVNLVDVTDTGSITTILRQRQMFRTDLVAADDVYKNGYITFTSGDNNGVSVEVKGYTQTNGRVELELLTPKALQVGDTFEIEQGCDGLHETCKTKFDNIVNFGGFRDMPGSDRLIKTPNFR